MFVENGYRRTEKIEIVEKSVVLEAPDVPSSVFATLPHGYSVYVFEA